MEEDQRLLERILDGAEDPTNLSLQLLKDITGNFSPERIIGQGGFGDVYKGILGEKVVAVKWIHINENTIDDRLFHREFLSLWNTNHRNLVRFFGFCSNTYQKTIRDAESGELMLASVLERLFCFEYISNGSLDKHITDELRGLEWETRYEIITGICKGLRYLHKEKQIIHMDLKPENILLHHQDDKYMVPKITDFHLSRLYKNSHTVGTRFGTRGYMAPEYEKYGKTTFMSDIYSLGAIIIEIVTGCTEVPDKDNVLRRWRHRWNKPPTQLQYQQVTRCINIAGRCREQNPEARPSVSKIISFLSESESTYSQMSPWLDEDDMLRINPLELRLPSVLKNETSCSVELSNDTINCIAFNIQPPGIKYIVQPVNGILQPKSKCYVNITVQAHDFCEHNHDDRFIVQSVNWGEGRQHANKVVDVVDLIVLYEPTKPQDNYKSGEETNMPAKEVSKFNEGGVSSSSRTKNYLSTMEPMVMTFQQLHSMTNGFSQVLGKGGFGTVYKGVSEDGEVIAVKKLNSNPGLVEASFMNELLNLMMVQHQNIIRLVGYCSEIRERVIKHEGKFVLAGEQERILCMEYMQGGDLDKHLYDESCGLDWKARYKIIKGICQGLKHLHKGYTEPIYHLDLKPANIFLDKDWIPKIGDFGLSRLVRSTDTFVTKTNSGTPLYMPPEYTHGQHISSKFDVFSLGVIIIQIIAGRGGYYNYKFIYKSLQEFIDHVTGNWSKRVQEKTMSTEALLEVQKCIKIALRCVEDNRENRPTITEIVQELMPETVDLHTQPFRADVEDLKSMQLPYTSLTNQALCSSLDRDEPVANSSVDINNDLLVQRGNKRRRQEDRG